MEGCSMMDGGMMGGMVAMWILWVLFAIVLIALAITALIWLVRSMRTPGRNSGTSSTGARDELDRRYATGDLSRDEYLERRRDLEG